jgi:hypothetical protein
MIFEFDGKTYLIEFKREYKTRLFHDPETGEESNVKTTHPYTTAFLYETSKEKPLMKQLFRTATVGCWHHERYSPEKGRVRALRMITRTIPKEMKPVMWKAYHERRKAVVVAPTSMVKGD